MDSHQINFWNYDATTLLGCSLVGSVAGWVAWRRTRGGGGGGSSSSDAHSLALQQWHQPTTKHASDAFHLFHFTFRSDNIDCHVGVSLGPRGWSDRREGRGWREDSTGLPWRGQGGLHLEAERTWWDRMLLWWQLSGGVIICYIGRKATNFCQTYCAFAALKISPILRERRTPFAVIGLSQEGALW